MGRTKKLAGVGGALLVLLSAAPASGSSGDDARYALAGGCYALRSESLGRLVTKDGEGYRAAAADAAQAEPFRMQATALGRYLLYGAQRDFLAAGSEDRVEIAPAAGDAADWRVDVHGDGTFRISSPAVRQVLAARDDGRLVLAEAANAGDATRFSFQEAQGCADYPEVEVNAVGEPLKGETPYGEATGLIDAHMHMMAFEFLGGRAHCGRPWHRFGAPYALVDCPDHSVGNGCAAVMENILYGNPARCHDPVGWPTFRDWPHHESLTHEQSYYKWLERAWRGGLRVFVNLFVENGVLCEVYPYKQNSCNEMNSVRLQARRIRELEDYIDAQNGGPGKGWFRIVTDPFEARRVINQGKLAVVLGIEISQLFDCGIYNDVPQCDKAQIDRQLEEVYRFGVRDLELINKFDNALGGVAGDSDAFGVAVNSANRYATGRYWQMQHCEDEQAHDREQISLPGTGRDSLVGNGLQALLPPGALPVYPDPPHCNTRGLSPLGEHVIRRMIERGMIIDPDHLSVLARRDVLALVEAARHSGIVSSHSWSSPDAIPRIYALGGVVTPYAGSSTGFVEEWQETKRMRSDRFFFGFGYGADMNGFGAQGGPREGNEANPVSYPFKSFDGSVTLHKQRSGERVYDINVDGVAHYGLYPDWIEDLRMIAGDEIIDDMARGAEAYLQMWERAVGVPAEQCRSTRANFTAAGLGRLRLGDVPEQHLQRGSQPEERAGRAWRYCVSGRGNGDAEVVSVFTPAGRVGLVASTAPGHRAGGVGPGARARELRGRTTTLGPGLRTRRIGRRGSRVVYGIRRGRVRYVALAARAVASKRSSLVRYLRLARER